MRKHFIAGSLLFRISIGSKSEQIKDPKALEAYFEEHPPNEWDLQEFSLFTENGTDVLVKKYWDSDYYPRIIPRTFIPEFTWDYEKNEDTCWCDEAFPYLCTFTNTNSDMKMCACSKNQIDPDLSFTVKSTICIEENSIVSLMYGGGGETRCVNSGNEAIYLKEGSTIKATCIKLENNLIKDFPKAAPIFQKQSPPKERQQDKRKYSSDNAYDTDLKIYDKPYNSHDTKKGRSDKRGQDKSDYCIYFMVFVMITIAIYVFLIDTNANSDNSLDEPDIEEGASFELNFKANTIKHAIVVMDEVQKVTKIEHAASSQEKIDIDGLADTNKTVEEGQII